MQPLQQTPKPNPINNMPIVNNLSNLSQITLKDLLESLCEQMTSTKLQNALPAVNVMNEVNTSTVDTPANPTSGGDDKNSIQDVMGNVSYPTHKWLGDNHVVTYEVGDPDINPLTLNTHLPVKAAAFWPT